MARELELPADCSEMVSPPTVTVFAGPEYKAVKWYSGTSRARFLIVVDDCAIDVNIQQASAIADMINEELRRPEH